MAGGITYNGDATVWPQLVELIDKLKKGRFTGCTVALENGQVTTDVQFELNSVVRHGDEVLAAHYAVSFRQRSAMGISSFMEWTMSPVLETVMVNLPLPKSIRW